MSPRGRGLLFFGLTLVLAMVFTRLGFWQLSRLAERRAANRAALTARDAEPRSLDVAANRADIAALQNRRITVTGRYDFTGEVVLRGQSEGGVPGVRLVTPLRPLEGDTAILVQRGFVPSPDAITVNLDRLHEDGVQQVMAIGFILPDSGTAGEPRDAGGRTSWRRIDLAALRPRFAYPVAPLLALQLPDSALPALPRRDAPLTLDDGPHLSYAVQWFSFAVTALVSGVLVGLRRKGGE